jgi:ABC-type phosphate transport system substrate-binding protein
MKTFFKLLPLSIVLLAFNAWAELAVIVAPSVNIDSINAEQLERLYLNRADRFAGGVPLQPLDQRSGSEQRTTFVTRVLGMSETELSEYWSRRMFSGKGHPPRTMENDETVIERVIADPGSIGYIDGDSVDDRVKVLLRIP